jgi:spore germination protein YaaH
MTLFMLGCNNSSDNAKADANDTAQRIKAFWNEMTAPQKIVLGYYENPWAGSPESSGSLPSLRTSYKSLTAIAPYWYKVGSDGSLETSDVPDVFREAAGLNLKVYPLVTNKRSATAEILGNPKVRQTATDNLAALAADYNYDGLNIDFELLPPDQRDNLTEFMKTLYPKMKERGKTVIISVFPQVGVHESVSGAYDYEALAKCSDYIQIMTYDNHWSTSKPGAIAPIGWYEDNIKYAIEKIGDAKKVLVGVGAYGYDWDLTKNEAETVTYAQAMRLAAEHDATVEYDDEMQAPHFAYENHEVWFENDASTAAKMAVIKKYKPIGIAIWRLGQEQPEIWPEIDKVWRQFEKN